MSCFVVVNNQPPPVTDDRIESTLTLIGAISEVSEPKLTVDCIISMAAMHSGHKLYLLLFREVFQMFKLQYMSF